MLSEAQARAVEADGHLLVPACPGAGKTTVLKRRVAHLLEVSSDTRVAAVTYTSAASESLEARIREQCPRAGKRVVVGTFHAMCIWQLTSARRAQRESAGERVDPSRIKLNILKEGQRRPLIYNAMKACNVDAGFEDVEEAISRRQSDVDLEGGELPYAEVFERFQQMKQRSDVFDFADLLTASVRGMRDGTVAPLDVDYLLVDEFQDTDRVQLAWVLEHVARGVRVTVVGDDDQSIYGFRGALGYECMMRFRDATDAATINLDRTYRCAVEILRPAAQLILHNRYRVEKRLVTANRTPGDVRVQAFEDRVSESRGCAQFVATTGDPGEWGILARTNAQLDEFEARIMGAFPYQRASGASFWETRGPGLLLGLAGSLADGRMLGVEALLGSCNLAAGFHDRLQKHFRNDDRGSLERFMRDRPPPGLERSDREFLAELQRQTAEWHALAHSRDDAEIELALNGMAHFIGRYAVARLPRSDDAQRRYRDMVAMAARALGSRRGSLSARINSMRRDNKGSGEGGRARLMTLHGAKGLEFERVWILGCDRGTLPSSQSDEDEERRLMYVGMTRAKQHLVLSHCLDKEPSPFLLEAGLLGGGVLGVGRDTVAACEVAA